MNITQPGGTELVNDHGTPQRIAIWFTAIMAGVVLLVGLAVIVWLALRRRTQDVPQSALIAKDGPDLSLQALDLSDPAGECDFHIVGESNYQPELRRVSRRDRKSTRLNSSHSQISYA